MKKEIYTRKVHEIKLIRTLKGEIKNYGVHHGIPESSQIFVRDVFHRLQSSGGKMQNAILLYINIYNAIHPCVIR